MVGVLAMSALQTSLVVAMEESMHVQTIRKLLNERRRANPAWVRAQSYPSFSKDDPADFFTDPEELKAQRERGVRLKADVAAAIEAGKKSFTIAPGEYRIAANKGWVFKDVKDLILLGNGARVWFERDTPNTIPSRLFFVRCADVTVKGLQIDFDPPVYIQGMITRIADDRRAFEMQIDPAWPKVSVPKGAFEVYSPEGRYVHQVSRGMHHTGAELFDGDRLRVKVWEGRGLTPNLDPERAKLFGDEYKVEPGCLVALNYRRSHAVTIRHGERITLEDVDIWQSPGGGISEHWGGGANVYRRVRLIRKPGTRRIHAGTADRFHSRGNRFGPKIIACEAGYTSDDIINIYGDWRWLLKQIDEKTVLVGSAVPLGEKLTFYERPELKVIDEAEVERAELVEDPATLAEVKAIKIPESARHIVERHPGAVYRVILKTPIKKITVPEVLIDAHSCNADNLVVRDCYFHDSFSRAQLFGGTVGARVENNIWDRMNHGVMIFEESWRYAMGPAPQDVTFTGNTVMNMGAGCDDGIFVSLVPAVVKLLNTQPSRNITITDNLLINASTITMTYVDGGKIENNILVEPRIWQRFQQDFSASKTMFGHMYFPRERRSAISVWSSKNVSVGGNTVYCSGPRQGMEPVDVGKWTENISLRRNHMLPLGRETARFDTCYPTPLKAE